MMYKVTSRLSFVQAHFAKIRSVTKGKLFTCSLSQMFCHRLFLHSHFICQRSYILQPLKLLPRFFTFRSVVVLLDVAFHCVACRQHKKTSTNKNKQVD